MRLKKVRLSASLAGEVYSVKTKTCEYWLIMTGEESVGEVWYRAHEEAETRKFGVVFLPKTIAEGEACVMKDLNGNTRIIIIPTSINESSIEKIPICISNIA